MPPFPGGADRSTVLLTLGTAADDREVLTRVVVATTALDVNVVVAPHQTDDLDMSRLDPELVLVAGFVPMADLLRSADLVVSAGGAGTVLSTLGAGLPSVLLPFGLDKPMNAERAAATGAALVVTDPDAIGEAVAKVLGDEAYPAAAGRMADEISAIDSPARVVDILTERAVSRPSIRGGVPLP
ncbi:nucleotide disphospho-sugar-binding domain-containing protein [Actinoplanes sp. NBRC 103695]|uniref:glycosyltransferase n=1 Tax=Actinoplanes sp. NBRC 103695 TaxID=3032202 RepID=UPI0024A0124A|nr:nucleotide disphospho-sugar-binding domain-containing protein [Actinoplanes sp. NBRC 103695]GLZ01786.1 hypothetical protein Acsp02_90370 [Actinoplanes sp. NBRC 103695]